MRNKPGFLSPLMLNSVLDCSAMSHSLIKVFLVVLMVISNSEAFAQQQSKTFLITKKQQLQYLLFLPQQYEYKPLIKYPLILFLHGSGESGNDIEKVKSQGLPKYLTAHPEFQAIVVSPQCPDSREGWNRFLLKDLLLHLRTKLNVDTNRVYITGMSMGGRGTWDMLAYYPELFAAAVPVCGWGDDRLVHRAKNVAVRIYHGADDDVVPAAYSSIMYEALRKSGADVTLTLYPGIKHDSWNKTYWEETLYDWLLLQCKK